MDLSNLLITRFREKNIWFSGFENHFLRLNDKTKELILDQFLDEMTSINGLYKFAHFWYSKIKDWEGYLDAELVYLSIKSLVLAGLNKQAKILSKGFEHHIGCLSWYIGSYFRENKEDKEFRILFKQFCTEIDSNISLFRNDPEVRDDVLAWKIAFLNVKQSIEVFEEYKETFRSSFPLYILLEVLIRNHMIRQCLQYIDYSKNYSNTLIVQNLILNKEAVLYQLTGNQDKAILTFELAVENATNLGDVIGLAKLNFNLGSSYFYQNNYQVALSYYKSAQSQYEKIGDDTGLAKVFNNVSTIYNVQGDFFKAEKYILLAKNIFEKTNFHSMTIGTSIKLADILKQKGEYVQSLAILNNFYDPNIPSIINLDFK